MDLQLTPTDLTQVSFVSRNTLRLLPPGKKPTRKVVIGDNEGSVEVFSVKKGETTRTFKQQLGAKGEAVTRLELGGKTGKKEQIYAAQGTTIRAVTKKGKEFFKLKTTLSEPITSMFVEDSSIWTTGDYVFTKFEDGKDRFFALATDRILEMTVNQFPGMDERGIILSCQDRFLRMVVQDTFFQDKLIAGAAAALAWNSSISGASSASSTDDQGPQLPGGLELIYGTENGLIGQMMVNKDTFTDGWLVPNLTKAGSVSNVAVADLTKDGLNDIVVGRDDGSVEVFCFDISPREPQANFKKSIGESIRSLETGHVSSAEYDEIIVAGYSGKIMSFCSDDAGDDEGTGLAVEGVGQLKEEDPEVKKQRRKKRKDNTRKQIRALREEVDRLAEKLQVTKMKQLQVTDEVISTQVTFHVNDTLRLIPEEAAYCLTLEIENAIDSVVIQSDVQLNLLDVDENLAIVCKSVIDSTEDASSRVIATYRCQDSVNRVQVKMRTFEGQKGTLRAYIIPRATPKTSKLMLYSVKPLSLHQRVYNVESDTPMNKLRFTGNFGLAEMHSWVAMAIPDVPAKTGEVDMLQMCFRSTFLETTILVTCKKGEATFTSDSLSSIAIIKDVITKEATNRKIHMDISAKLNDESLPHVLGLVENKLTPLFRLAERKKVLDALKEIRMQEDDLSFMNEEYVETLNDADKIEKEFALQEDRLHFLYNIIRNLYLDYQSLRALDGSGRIPELNRLLERYEHEKLLNFFGF